MIETKEKEINGNVYSVTQLPARRALKLKAKLLKMFGAALTQLFLTAFNNESKEQEEEQENALVDNYKVADMKNSAFVKGIQLLVSNVDDKTFDELCLEILQGVRRNGAEMTSQLIDMSFAGKLTDLYLVMFFVLEVNFADFFAFSGIGSLSQATNPLSQDTKKTYTFC